MRFALGPIPEDATFHPEAEGWTLLREPRTAHLMLVAAPIGVLMSGGPAMIWSLVLPPMASRIHSRLPSRYPSCWPRFSCWAGSSCSMSSCTPRPW